MKIYIDTDKLTDAPFDVASKYPFSFDEEAVLDIVSDIRFGNPTCYLISGYRGAGKSSFVRKVESVAIADNNSTLFVHVNFTKYKSQNYLLRKLIRAIYQSLIEAKYKHVLENLVAKETKLAKEAQTLVLLERLYDQTFNEVSDSQQILGEETEERRIEVDFWLFFSFSLISLLSLSNIIYTWITSDIIPTVIILIASSVAAIREAISIKSYWSKKNVFTKDFQRKSMYDDEISDFHFNTLLDKFSSNEIKLVFVLDELDKVGADEVDPLINEMKPYLVSGKASFIVVAGQSLYYKYKSAQTEDDAVISTLFSRIVHVPLQSIEAFKNIFDGLINKGRTDNPPSPEYQTFLDYLIFQSKRVPRRFVNLIREKINWQDSKCIIVDDSSAEYRTASIIITAINNIDNEEVAVSFSEGARDYVIMQLYLKAEKILSMRLGDQVFTQYELLTKGQKEQDGGGGNLKSK